MPSVSMVSEAVAKAVAEAGRVATSPVLAAGEEEKRRHHHKRHHRRHHKKGEQMTDKLTAFLLELQFDKQSVYYSFSRF